MRAASFIPPGTRAARAARARSSLRDSRPARKRSRIPRQVDPLPQAPAAAGRPRDRSAPPPPRRPRPTPSQWVDRATGSARRLPRRRRSRAPLRFAATPAVSIPTRGCRRVAPFASVSPGPAPCVRRRADPPREPRGVAPPLVACRRATWRRRSFHVLLQSPHRMVVMHARRAGSRPEGRRNLLVLEPLLRPQQEHLTLHAGQLLQPRREPPLRLAGDRPLVRIAVRGPHVVAERHHARPPGPPVRVLQDVAADRHQPGAKLTLAAEPPERAERPDEGLLHQVV